MSKLSGTWTYKPLFDRKTVQESKTITLKERFLLLFHKRFRAFDSGADGWCLVEFKIRKNKKYILKITRGKPNPPTEETK